MRRYIGPMAVCAWMVLVAALPGRAAAQHSGEAILAQVQAAFNAGDARALLEPSAERIEISLFGVNTFYSRSQALYVLQDFFREYPPGRCTLQSPSRTDGNWFAGGLYAYGPSNRQLQVYVRVRERGDRWELREVRIEHRARE